MVIFDSTGRPLFRGGIVRDITERRRTEEIVAQSAAELARVHQDLKSAHREANLYLDILTHDIGNTENVSNLYAELLAGSVEGEAARYAANLKRSIENPYDAEPHAQPMKKTISLRKPLRLGRAG